MSQNRTTDEEKRVGLLMGKTGKSQESNGAKANVAGGAGWELQLDAQDEALSELHRANLSLAQRVEVLKEKSSQLDLTRVSAELAETAKGIAADRRLIDDLSDEVAEVQIRRGRGTSGDASQKALVVDLNAVPGLMARLDEIRLEVEKLRKSNSEQAAKVDECESLYVDAVTRDKLMPTSANREKDRQVAEMKKAEQEIERRIEEPTVVRAQVSQRDASLAVLGVDAQALNTIKIHYNQEIERLRDAYRNEVALVKSDRAALTAELAETKGKSEDLRREILNNKSEVEKSKIEAERMAFSIRAEFAQSINQKDLKIQEIEAVRAASEREIKRLQGVESRVKSDLLRAEDRFRKVEADLRNEASKYQSEYLRISGKLASASEQLGVLRAEKLALQKEAGKVAELAQALNGEKLRIQEFESGLVIKTREIERLQEAEKSLRADLEHLADRSRSIEAELKAESSKYQAELARTAAQLATAVEQVAKLRAEKQGLERELKEAGTQGKTLAEKEFKLHERESTIRIRDQEIERLLAVEVKLRAEFERQTTRYESAEKTMRSELVEMGAENSRLKVQIASSQEQISALKAEKVSIESDLKKAAELAASASVLDVKCQELEAKSAFANKEIQRLSDVETKLREQLERTESKLQDLDEQTRSEIVKYQTQVSKLSVQLAASAEQISSMKSEKIELEKGLERAMAANEALSLKLSKLQESEIEFESGAREVARLIESEQRVKNEYAKAVDQFRDVESDLREKLSLLQSEVARSEVALSVTNEKLASLKSERAELQKEAEKALAYREELSLRDRRVRELEATLESNEHEIERLRETEQRLQMDLARSTEHFREIEDKLRNEASKYQAELVAMSNNVAEISEQVTGVRLERDELESQLNRAREQVHTLTGKAVKLREVEAQCEAFEQQYRRMSAHEQKLRGELEAFEQRFRSMEIQLRADLSKFQVENGSLAAQLTGARDSIALLKSEKSNLESELAKTSETTAKLREEAYQQQQSVHLEREDAARQARETEMKLNSDISATQMRLSHAESRVRESQAQIHSLELQITENQKVADKEIVSLKKIIADLEGKEKDWLVRASEAEQKASLAESRLAESNELAAELTLRENQLRIYSGGLTREKAELQKIAKTFVSEIRLLSSTHPLKDYLQATEFEISKVEAQLSTMPTIMAERARVEEGMKKLLQQRDFLKTVLADSQKQFENQALKVEKIVASGALAPVPPPPPAVRRSQKATERRQEGDSSGVTKALENLRWEKPMGDLT